MALKSQMDLIFVLLDQDGAEPSGNSVAANNLLRLGCILDCPEMKEKASKLLSSFTSRLSRIPVALPEMVSALMLYHDAPTLVSNSIKVIFSIFKLFILLHHRYEWALSVIPV